MDKIIGRHTRGLGSLKEISLGQGQAEVERALTQKSRACVLHQLTACPWAKHTPSTVLQMRGGLAQWLLLAVNPIWFPNYILYRTPGYKTKKRNQDWEPRAHPLRLSGLRGSQLENCRNNV